jgi:hypothetical protein
MYGHYRTLSTANKRSWVYEYFIVQANEDSQFFCCETAPPYMPSAKSVGC